MNSTLLKRKRSDATTTDEDIANEPSEPSDEESIDSGPEPEEGEEFNALKPKPKALAKVKRKARAPPPPKKPRVRAKKAAAPKVAAKITLPKPKKTTTRKAKQGGADSTAFDAEKVAQDTRISGDNPLFSA